MKDHSYSILVIILSVMVSGSAVHARPNHWAQNGALDVFFASSEEQGLLSLSFIHVGGGYSDYVYGHDYMAFGFAPALFTELSFGVYANGYRIDDDNYLIGPIFVSPALKFGYPFYFVPEPRDKSFFLAPGFVALGRFATASYWADSSMTVAEPTPAIDLVGILGLGNRLVNFHLNAGYEILLEETNASAAIPYGLALQVSPLKFLDLIVEVSNRAPSSDLGSMNALQFTPMVRMSTAPVGGAIFDIAIPVGIGSQQPPWKIEIGVSASFDLIKPPKVPHAHLYGRVLDETTATPLAATLSFPEADVEPALTDSLTGDFSVELTPGVYRIRAESQGYKWKEKGVVLQDGEEKVLDFSLAREKQEQAQLTGKVIDAGTAQALEGVLISFNSSEIPDLFTDALGIFKSVLPPGTYLVSFTKGGYEKVERSVSLKDGEHQELNIGLAPPRPKEEPEFENITFNPGSVDITPQSFAALEKVAAFLSEYPNVRMEIQGHTDSVGDDDANLDLSQKRADAVKTWLVNKGIDASRLMARGYGETQPIADNRTRSGQETNRRIVFVILSE